jgi:hypothetical protein
MVVAGRLRVAEDAIITVRVSEIEAEAIAVTRLTVGRLASEALDLVECAWRQGGTRAAITALAVLERLQARLAQDNTSSLPGIELASDAGRRV